MRVEGECILSRRWLATTRRRPLWLLAMLAMALLLHRQQFHSLQRRNSLHTTHARPATSGAFVIESASTVREVSVIVSRFFLSQRPEIEDEVGDEADGLDGLMTPFAWQQRLMRALEGTSAISGSSGFFGRYFSSERGFLQMQIFLYGLGGHLCLVVFLLFVRTPTLQSTPVPPYPLPLCRELSHSGTSRCVTCLPAGLVLLVGVLVGSVGAHTNVLISPQSRVLSADLALAVVTFAATGLCYLIAIITLCVHMVLMPLVKRAGFHFRGKLRERRAASPLSRIKSQRRLCLIAALSSALLLLLHWVVSTSITPPADPRLETPSPEGGATEAARFSPRCWDLTLTCVQL